MPTKFMCIIKEKFKNSTLFLMYNFEEQLAVLFLRVEILYANQFFKSKHQYRL